METMGRHVISELWGCDFEKLSFIMNMSTQEMKENRISFLIRKFKMTCTRFIFLIR